MRTEVEEVDAEKARLYLSKNPTFESGKKGTNRPISYRWVNIIARDMLNGEWLPTHQGIAFDKRGKLKDGQHRLLAVVQAAEEGADDGEHHIPANPKIKVKFQVTYDLEPNTFDVIDVGRTRTSGQILAMAGYTNAIKLGAAGRLLYLFDHHDFNQWRAVKVPNHTVLDYVTKTNLADYINVATALQEVGFIQSAVMVGYYVCHRALPEGPHEEFLEALRTGENMKSEDPRLVLRNQMIRSKGTNDHRRDSALHLALYIKAWNDFVNKRRRSQLTWHANQAFPRPVEATNGEDE